MLYFSIFINLICSAIFSIFNKKYNQITNINYFAISIIYSSIPIVKRWFKIYVLFIVFVFQIFRSLTFSQMTNISKTVYAIYIWIGSF